MDNKWHTDKITFNNNTFKIYVNCKTEHKKSLFEKYNRLKNELSVLTKQSKKEY